MILDRVVKWLLPRENRFFVYLEEIAKHVTAAGDAFAELRKAQDHTAFKAVAERLRAIEQETDQVAHLLYEELDKTFVTPLDREDLHALTSRLDEVVDILETCAAHIAIYQLEKLTPPMLELVRINQEAAHEVARCISLLQDLSKVDEIQVHLIHVTSLENEADKIFRKALGQLFSDVKDPIELIREKEVLETLENSIDACKDVMNLVRSVVVKNG